MLKNNKFARIFSAVFFFLLITFTFNSSISWMSSPQQKEINTFPQKYRIVSPPFPNKLDFCGEKVPLENMDVWERIDREFIVNSYWHSATVLYLKRANRWFPVIEPILEANKIPDDMKYLAIAESGFDNVVSPKGATGFWQFISEAGKKYGLEINNEIDERYHVEKSTEAACKYLNDSYNKFGTWAMAAASYNMGENGVETQMERQKTNNYYNLVLGEETSRYMARIISLKIIMEHPEYFGFSVDSDDLYRPYETFDVSVSGKIDNFADFALQYGINYKILKMYNPWLRENYLTNRKKQTYVIKMPLRGSIYVIPEHEF